ncbi:MAG TPA: hypothetical protein VIL48_07920 [Acidimicrobiales bacterium]
MSRERVRQVRRAWWIAVATVLVVAACGGDDDGGDEGSAPSPEAAETADTVCTMLRDWNNDLGNVLNATSQTITDQDDPTTANGVLLVGFDEMIELAEQHRREVSELELPDVPQRDELLAELAEGADESLAVLEEERADAAELPPITPEEQRGALGGAFTGVERALSVIEPRIGAYDEDLQRAFADDEGCRHVVQPTGDN